MAVKPEKSTSNTNPEETSDEAETKLDERKVCGIVMPIAAMGEDYTEAHWSRVRRILQRAIDRAGLRSQLVWENPEVDVIQTAILQNLFENDVVVCDVSNLNPNVMLETGLRLSTKRPTIIVTDRVKRPPFDISTIAYIDYPRDLEYNATEDFISKLTRKIKEVIKAVSDDKYKPYIEQFRFETVQPDSVTVTTDEYVKERLDDLTVTVRRLARIQEAGLIQKSVSQAAPPSPAVRDQFKHLGSIIGNFDQTHAANAEMAIDMLEPLVSHVKTLSANKYRFDVRIRSDITIAEDLESYLLQCREIISNEEANYLFG